MGQRNLSRFRALAAAHNRPQRMRCDVVRGRGVREKMPPSSKSPAMEWIIEVSKASAGDSGGNIPASRAASMDLPEPGGPTISMWCRPAAAISKARFARSCPFTSNRSRAPVSVVTSPGLAGASGAWPVKWRISCDSVSGARTRAASTQAASGPQGAGQTSAKPASAAAMAAGKSAHHGHECPIKREFAQRDALGHLLGRQDVQSCKQGHGDGQVEMRPFLHDIGGRQVDGDPL